MGIVVATLASCARAERVPSFPTYAVGGARLAATGSELGEDLEVLLTRPDGTRGELPSLSWFDGPGTAQFSPSGDLLLLDQQPAGDVVRVQTTIVDLRTGRGDVLTGHADCMSSLCRYAFSPDSSLVAWAAAGEVEIFRIVDGGWRVVRRHPLGTGESLLGITNDGTLATYVDGASHVRLSDPRGQVRQLRSAVPGRARSDEDLEAAFLPVEGLLVLAAGRGVSLLDTRTGATRKTLRLPGTDTGLPVFAYVAGASRTHVVVGYSDYDGSLFVRLGVEDLSMTKIGKIDGAWLDRVFVSTSRMATGVSIADLRRAASRTVDPKH